MAKNSPSAMSSVTSSTARTAPKWRETFDGRLETGMAPTCKACGSRLLPAKGEDRRGRPPVVLPPAEDGYVVRDPAVIGHACALLAHLPPASARTRSCRNCRAVGVAACVGEQRVALAGGGHRRHRAEPGGEIALQLRVDRMLEPHIGAVRMRASACIMVVSAQPVAPSSGMVEAIGFFSDSRRLTWNGQDDEATTPSFLKSSICTMASCQ